MLFTVPITLNDGTTNRSFDWLRQEPSQLAGLYREPAATAVSASRIRTSHMTEKSGRERHLLQSSENIALVDPGDNDPTMDSVIINISIAHHPKHAAADVEKRLKLALAAASISGFTADIMAQEI